MYKCYINMQSSKLTKSRLEYLPQLKNTKQVLQKVYIGKKLPPISNNSSTYHVPTVRSTRRDLNLSEIPSRHSSLHNHSRLMHSSNDTQLFHSNLNDKLRSFRESRREKNISEPPRIEPTKNKHIMIEFGPERLVTQPLDKPSILFSPVPFYD